MTIWKFASVLLSLAGGLTATATELTYNLSLDTSQVSGGASLDFAISGFAGNTVTISNPVFTGGGSLNAGEPSSVTLTTPTDPTVITQEEALWDFTAGSSISFTLSTTDNGPSGAGSIFGPDTVLIFFDDPSRNPYSTSDPSGGNALFDLSLTGGADKPSLYTGTEPPINGIGFTQGSSGDTGTGSAPEPASSALLGLSGAALTCLALLNRRRRTQQNS